MVADANVSTREASLRPGTILAPRATRRVPDPERWERGGRARNVTVPDCCQPDDVSAGANITRDDPGLELDAITACLDAEYATRVTSITFLPLGYDLKAAVYKIITEDGTAYFLKIRFGQVNETGLLVPWAL